ncbi:hypothetical protein TNCV_4479131 [Trichonephila clavipes]|nr:hypothetical protein TNCV_4479131 [Trichonephila clavipes]
MHQPHYTTSLQRQRARTHDTLVTGSLSQPLYTTGKRYSLSIWTLKQSSIPCRDKSLMLGMAKVVVFILLSGMTAIGRTMGSGRRGYGASSGRKSSVFWVRA